MVIGIARARSAANRRRLQEIKDCVGALRDMMEENSMASMEGMEERWKMAERERHKELTKRIIRDRRSRKKCRSTIPLRYKP
jgi:hypothetical protein